jgi:hypothetical protein
MVHALDYHTHRAPHRTHAPSEPPTRCAHLGAVPLSKPLKINMILLVLVMNLGENKVDCERLNKIPHEEEQMGWRMKRW